MRKLRFYLFLVIAMSVLLTGCSTPYQVAISEAQSQEVLNVALDQIEKSYVWGGRGPDEFDCSGLLTWSIKQVIGEQKVFRVGNFKTTDATMQDLYDWNVILITPQKVRPGDIVFITNDRRKVTHGGLFVSWIDETQFNFINASSRLGKVALDTWSINKTIREQWFVAFGRIQISY